MRVLARFLRNSTCKSLHALCVHYIIPFKEYHKSEYTFWLLAKPATVKVKMVSMVGVAVSGCVLDEIKTCFAEKNNILGIC